MEIFASKKYDRNLKKLVRKNSEIYTLVLIRLRLLKNSPTHPSLRLHKLSNRDNEYAISYRSFHKARIHERKRLDIPSRHRFT